LTQCWNFKIVFFQELSKSFTRYDFCRDVFSTLSDTWLYCSSTAFIA
jgi:hypothetical protein